MDRCPRCSCKVPGGFVGAPCPRCGSAASLDLVWTQDAGTRIPRPPQSTPIKVLKLLFAGALVLAGALLFFVAAVMGGSISAYVAIPAVGCFAVAFWIAVQKPGTALFFATVIGCALLALIWFALTLVGLAIR